MSVVDVTVPHAGPDTLVLGIPASASLLSVWADAAIRRRRTSMGPAGPDAHSASPADPNPTRKDRTHA